MLHTDSHTARNLVMTYGWNATAYQILNPGIEHWFSPDEPAVVGYTARRGFYMVAGSPVCAEASTARVVAGFEAFARDHGRRVCYVCAEEPMRQLITSSQPHAHAIVAIGAQPTWDPREWDRTVATHASIRAQLNRSRNKGVKVDAIDPADAARDRGLRPVLAAWLRARNLPPLHFLVEPHLLGGGVLADRLVLVARRDDEPVAFLVASPIAARAGYLIEQVARLPQAPNGTAELLIDAAMRRFAAFGCVFATLGLVALSTQAAQSIRLNPVWLRMLMRFARLHANRFYNFRGLEHFRLKLAPARWDPVYAISNEPRFSLRALCAIGEAFAGTAPWRVLALGAARALRHELSTIGLLPLST
jgi:phosphatidylglycerol lysyltransferase